MKGAVGLAVEAWHDVAELRWAVLAAVALVGAVGFDLAGVGVIAVGAYVLCYLAGGWQPAREGLEALATWRLDVDLLMVVAAVGAAAMGQWQDGGLLIVIFAISGALEEVATRRTERSINELAELSPEVAEVVRDDGTVEPVAAEVVVPGDVALVRPGIRVPADGTVVTGHSEVDEAAVTGEPMPAPKSPGTSVYAGTINGSGALRVQVERAASDSVVARIRDLVERATATRTPTQLFIERFEQRYSVAVVAVTVAVLGVGPAVIGWPLETALLRAMTFMIVASPCAVVLATMPAMLSAVATAGKNGVLVKGPDVLERIAAVDALVVDKTGTLTEGAPSVSRVAAVEGTTQEQVLAVAAAAEAASEHALARAIVAYADEQGVQVPAASDTTALPGRGVQANVDGRRVTVGNRRLLDDPGRVLEPLLADFEANGHTAVGVAVDGAPLGAIGIHDRVRHGAATAVQAFRGLDIDPIVLLTGDNAPAAELVANHCGIEQVQAGLLPDDKATHVRALQDNGKQVLVLGDGINDAPAIATGNVGAAMGLVGSDLTLQTADVVLRSRWLDRLPATIQLARSARRLVRTNLTLALAAIGVLVILDFAGHLPLVLGVAGHEGSTLLVALNGLRLLRNRHWPTPTTCTRPGADGSPRRGAQLATAA